MNWKAFGVGCGLAALAAALQYAQVLPGMYGAAATAGLSVVTLLMKARA